jgi:hypothetical protein
MSYYERESSAAGWFVGIIVALALSAIGYVIFAASSARIPPTITEKNGTTTIIRELSKNEIFKEKNVFTDPLTGCQYIKTSYGLIVRFGADHLQICKSE